MLLTRVWPAAATLPLYTPIQVLSRLRRILWQNRRYEFMCCLCACGTRAAMLWITMLMCTVMVGAQTGTDSSLGFVVLRARQQPPPLHHRSSTAVPTRPWALTLAMSPLLLHARRRAARPTAAPKRALASATAAKGGAPPAAAAATAALRAAQAVQEASLGAGRGARRSRPRRMPGRRCCPRPEGLLRPLSVAWPLHWWPLLQPIYSLPGFHGSPITILVAALRWGRKMLLAAGCM